MDDFQAVSFMDLLSQSVSRCVTDWRCFCDRQEKDASYVDNHVRTGIIQFCRAQREIFLKLHLLHDFMCEQNRLDRVLEKMYSFENYLEKCGSEIAMNLRKVQTSDLMVACPNTALAVDLLSSGKYTRMPLMLPQLAESAISNTVPLPPLTSDETDLAMARIYSEYYLQLQKADCRDKRISMECKNGQCIFTRERFFSITLIYDFSSWQALSAVPLLLEQFGCSTEGEARSSFLTLVMYVVAIFNVTKKGNIFDVVFDSVNLYCGKLLMERLKGQASDYRGLKLTVTNYKFFVTTHPDQMLISCSDVRPPDGEFLFLEVACLPGFKYQDLEGVTLRFQMDKRGHIIATVVEIPELLNEVDIEEHRLDQWLERVAILLERYQLDILNYEGDVFMNYSTGALNIVGLPIPFTLEEANMLMMVMTVRASLMEDRPGCTLVDSVSRDLLRNIWHGFKCPICADSMHVESSPVVLSEKVKDFLCDFWFYLEDRISAVHGVASYEVKLDDTELGMSGISRYVSVITHDQNIVGNAILVISVPSTLLGVIMLSHDYSEYNSVHSMMIAFIKVVKQFAELGEVITKTFGPQDTHIVCMLNDVEFTINSNGDCDSVTHSGITVPCKSYDEAYKIVLSKLTKG